MNYMHSAYSHTSCRLHEDGASARAITSRVRTEDDPVSLGDCQKFKDLQSQAENYSRVYCDDGMKTWQLVPYPLPKFAHDRRIKSYIDYTRSKTLLWKDVEDNFQIVESDLQL